MTTLYGTLWVDDFDRGVVTTLGGEIVSYSRDGEVRKAYAIDIDDYVSDFSELEGRVPVSFVNPTEVYRPHVLPCIVIRRSSMNPAFERKAWYGILGRKPAVGAVQKTVKNENNEDVQGYDKYTYQWRATPFDIQYDVQAMCQAKYGAMNVGLVMLKHVLKRFEPPWFRLTVVDSKGETRNYDAGDLTVENTSELADIANRLISHTISFTVRAELDLWKDFDGYSFSEDPVWTLTRYEPGELPL